MKARSYNAVTMFAEDVRAEASGSETLLGVMTDQIAVPSFPGGLPKLACYTRVTVDPNHPPASISVRLRWEASGVEVIASNFESDLIQNSVGTALAEGTPLATFLMKFVMVSMPIERADRLIVVATIDDEEFVTGSVRFMLS